MNRKFHSIDTCIFIFYSYSNFFKMKNGIRCNSHATIAQRFVM